MNVYECHCSMKDTAEYLDLKGHKVSFKAQIICENVRCPAGLPGVGQEYVGS